ncbi:OPT family oligopeptide transporter, partial [Salmonella enterica]|nr:OPT family oligopeptide transporter [Salmonella enterica]
CALVVVALTYDFYFQQDKIVPASRLYAATIQAGSSSDVAMMLLLWAIPGAVIQLIGGAKNQIGVLFSTGLMINYPIAGWTVLVALAVRV